MLSRESICSAMSYKISFYHFDYATAGDTDGEYATSSFGYTYNDVEHIIAPRFGRVEVLRDDLANAGSAPYTIPAGTTIAPYGYLPTPPLLREKIRLCVPSSPSTRREARLPSWPRGPSR